MPSFRKAETVAKASSQKGMVIYMKKLPELLSPAGSMEALAAADFVTVSNEEHAIAQVICDIESGKYQF